ncbi:MAG TPA: cupredoxin domain-containing protein [Nocardioides sp.]|uniref:cupredoxin domain-containing protein n=1 Tax=Nocardioides sp. TaxID=35761 RepID=UPI002F40AC91
MRLVPAPRRRATSSTGTPLTALPRRLARLGLVAGLPLLTSGCVKSGISQKAADTHDLFYIILWLALPVFLFVEGMLVVCVIAFRRRKGDQSVPVQDYGSNRALFAFFGGPLVVVVILLAFGEHTLSTVDHVDPHPDLEVTVTGFQWEWSATYPKAGFTVSGETLKSPMVMELPVDQTTRITLTSNDVIHEFYVPDLLFMKNAVPGNPNVFTIRPTKIGTYHSQCAQYCGLWHSKMKFDLKVVSAADFAAWQTQEKKATTPSGTCAPTGSSITLTAHNIHWDKKCIAVEADKPITVTIDNKDAGIAHDFGVWQSSKLKHEFFATPKVTGVSTKTFKLPALKAGKYYFQCDVHGPAMSGVLIVGGS